MNKGAETELEWKDGRVPVSRRFDDPYYSLEDGLAEARHVFLSGNDLPERFTPGFAIAELGYGTGLNALAAWQMWEVSGQRGVLHYTSFERFPMTAEDRARALDRWPELRPYAEKLDARGEVRSDVMQIRVIEGDARRALPDWEGSADAWFLDGFAPARNPELWEQSLMKAVARHTRPGGSFATYSAAGAVRRGLSEAGFSIERVPGFGRKRHMLKGTLAP